MHSGRQVKCPLLMSDCNETGIVLDRFSKNTQTSNMAKIHSVGAEFFHAEKRTDMTKLTVGFRNFGNMSKNEKLLQLSKSYYQLFHLLIVDGMTGKKQGCVRLLALARIPKTVKNRHVHCRFLLWNYVHYNTGKHLKKKIRIYTCGWLPMCVHFLLQ